MTILAFTLPSFAQQDEGSTPDIQIGNTQRAKTLDDIFAEVVAQVPAFGGMFTDDSTDTLYLFLTDLDQRSRDEALAKLHGALGRGRLPQQNIQILPARYDFSQLKSWYDNLATAVLATPSVVFTDIDEAKNLLRIGISDLSKSNDVELILAQKGIPRDAVIIELSKPVKFEYSLQGYYRPLVGELQISYFVGSSQYVCTLGATVIRQGSDGFVTNSHFTATRGVVENTVFHQPLSSNRIGVESIDPNFFTGGPCPSWRRCRYSDAAYASREVGAFVSRIANADIGSPNWGGGVYRIIGEVRWPVSGEYLVKVGRSTGKTTGTVQSTCANVNVGLTDITMLCQDRANYSSSGGDSGSPVFAVTNSPYTGDALLYGLHWGSNGWFSAIGAGNVKYELGGFTTADPGVCPRCGDWDCTTFGGVAARRTTKQFGGAQISSSPAITLSTVSHLIVAVDPLGMQTLLTSKFIVMRR